MTDEEKKYNRYLNIKDKIKNREDRQFLIEFLLNEGYKKGLAEGRKGLAELEEDVEYWKNEYYYLKANPEEA